MDKLSADKAHSSQLLMNHFDSINTVLNNMCLSAAGLAIGSVSAAKVKIVNTVTYLAASVFKSKATAEIAFTATTHNIPNSTTSVQEAMFLVGLAPDGTPSLTMGTIATGAGQAQLPATPAGVTAIGSVRIAVAAGATPFTASTDLLSAGHLTVAYRDLGFVAPRFDAAVN